jgi:hypothetical protein
MSSSYKNVRLRHPSGAPINTATPLPVDIIGSDITLDVDLDASDIVDVSTLATHAKQDTLAGLVATAANQRVVANTTEYTQAALVANVLTIASSKGLYLKNDGTSDFTITIGSLTFTVKPGEVRCIETAAAFTTVTFSAGATFRAFGVTRAA